MIITDLYLCNFLFLSLQVLVDEVDSSPPTIMDVNLCWPLPCAKMPTCCVWAVTPWRHTLWTWWHRWTTSTAFWALPWRTTTRGHCSCRWTTHLWMYLQFWKWNGSYQSAGTAWAARSISMASCSAWLSRSSSWRRTFWPGTKRASSSPRPLTTSVAWWAQDLLPSTFPRRRTMHTSNW